MCHAVCTTRTYTQAHAHTHTITHSLSHTQTNKHTHTHTRRFPFCLVDQILDAPRSAAETITCLSTATVYGSRRRLFSRCVVYVVSTHKFLNQELINVAPQHCTHHLSPNLQTPVDFSQNWIRRQSCGPCCVGPSEQEALSE